MLKISIFLLFSCVSIGIANAQIPSSIDGITISSNPENPAPKQDVRVSIESYNTDLSSASIVWNVDGKTYSKGIGIKSISVTAPKTGVPMNVTAYIRTVEGRDIQKIIIIKSGSVDIIWEPKGYTPPFFKGKNPFVYQNDLHIVAIPHLSADGVREISPNSLIYKWKLNGKYIENASGQGKQSVNIKADQIPKQLEVGVEVYSANQQQSIVGTLLLDPTSPSLMFYEEDPLYGIYYNKALIGRIPLKNSEMRVLSVPFGFNVDSKGSQNSYNWSINNVEQPDLSKNQSIVIRTKGDQEGSSDINLEMRNLNNILQGARENFTVYFSKKQNQEENIEF